MQRWEIISTGETLGIYNQHVIIIYDIIYKHILEAMANWWENRKLSNSQLWHLYLLHCMTQKGLNWFKWTVHDAFPNSGLNCASSSTDNSWAQI